MKHLIKYLGALLAVVLIGTTFTACSEDDAESANVGLGIKTFFPTKVVTNQPIAINGSGFNAVTEIEFPGGQKVTDFEIVGNDMIRVNAPSGIDVNGGNIIVRTSSEQAESRVPLTVGHTVVTGFSKQPGEEANGGEQISVFGTDLEFINNVELLNAEGEAQLLDQKDFYRKGTSSVIFTLPKKDIFEGTWTGTLHTYDGQSIAMPELTYKPAKDEGHYEIVKTSIWKNDGSVAEANWNGIYRFGLEGNDGGNECVATFPQDVWDKLKSETFYVTVKGANPQIRVTNGWWDSDATWTGADIQPGNELLTDNGDGTWTLKVDLAGSTLVGTIDQKHLLFTGSGYTVEEIFFQEETWVDGPGMQEVEVPVWTNGGTVAEANWNGIYRFGLEGNDGGNECVATFPQDVWDKLKSETFYVTVKGANPQIRVTNGWWDSDATWTGADIQPGNELLTDNGDGTWTLKVDLAGSTLVGTIDQKHLLFTGSGYTVEKIYFIEMQAGGGGTSEIDIAPFTLYEDRSANLSWPYFPSWSDNSGKLRIMRGLGDTPIETLGLTTSSKFVVYKEAGTTGQIQFNNPNWVDLQAGCNDWDGSLEQIEVPITEDMLKCINGEVVDGWSDTALILQGDGLTVKKIVIVK